MSVETPLEERREIPQKVEIGIRGSELFVVGEVDHVSNIITNAKIEHRPGSLTPMSEVATDTTVDQKETVWRIETDKDFWQIHLKGYEKDTSTCNNIDVKRNDGAQWHYTLTSGEGPEYPSTDLVFSRAQNYLAPIFKPNEKNTVEMKGKRLIAVEPLNKADYVGTVEPAFKVTEDGIQIVTQSAKHTSPKLEGVSTIRAVRASVHKPDYDNLKPIPGTIPYKLKEVDLHPDLIASAPTGQKMRVNIIGLEYGQDVNIPENQTLTPMREYADTSADGVGFVGLYQLFTEKFANHLGVNEEGVNNETSEYVCDPNESYGKPISIGLIKGDRTWRVIYENDPKGKFDRDGNPIPAKVGRNFDPGKVNATPIQVHTFKPVNPNNARETGTNTLDGLHPVQVYVYEKSEATTHLASDTLCDYKDSGDGPTQMGLFEWEAHAYGEVFNKVAKQQLA